MTPSIAQLDKQRLPSTLVPLACLLAKKTSVEQATLMRNSGVITLQQWRWFVLLWTWTATGLSDVENAAKKHHRCFNVHGIRGLERRSERAQRLKERLWTHWFKPYLKTNHHQPA